MNKNKLYIAYICVAAWLLMIQNNYYPISNRLIATSAASFLNRLVESCHGFCLDDATKTHANFLHYIISQNPPTLTVATGLLVASAARFARFHSQTIRSLFISFCVAHCLSPRRFAALPANNSLLLFCPRSGPASARLRPAPVRTFASAWQEDRNDTYFSFSRSLPGARSVPRDVSRQGSLAWALVAITQYQSLLLIDSVSRSLLMTEQSSSVDYLYSRISLSKLNIAQPQSPTLLTGFASSFDRSCSII